MVLIPFTIDPWARFGPMLQAFLTPTHHPHQKPWHTTHAISKYHQPNTNLMYEHASKPPCSPGILTSADIRWTQSMGKSLPHNERKEYNYRASAATAICHPLPPPLSQIAAAVAKAAVLLLPPPPSPLLPLPTHCHHCPPPQSLSLPIAAAATIVVGHRLLACQPCLRRSVSS